MVSTLAGQGFLPFSPDGTRSDKMHLILPQAMVTDAAGNIYISERYYYRVIKITPGGIVTTVAGTGTSGYNGDSIPASQAQLNDPYGLAFDSGGNLFFGDGARVRKISGADGTITTFAGNGRVGTAGNEGPAVSAPLGTVTGLTFDAQGNLYIADASNHVIRRVDRQGIIHAVAGAGRAGFSDGPAASALFNSPRGIALDTQGNLYVADFINNRIRKITPNGTVSTLAGNGTPGFLGENVLAGQAELGQPDSLVVHNGNLYVGDEVDSRVRMVALSTNIITTVIGGGASTNFSGARPTQVFFGGPSGIAFSPSGDMYAASQLYRLVVKLPNAANSTLSVIAGTASLIPGDGGPATSAYLLSPFGVASDAAGNIYVADDVDHRLRKIATDGTIRTFAGTSVFGFTGDGGQATAAELAQPRAMTFDRGGNLLFSTTAGLRIRKIDQVGVITTIAGSDKLGYGGDKGPAVGALFFGVMGLATDQHGNIYVADANNNRIRIITPNNTVDTFAGTGDANFGGDNGLAVKAQLSSPRGVAVDSQGNIYVADTNNARIRKITPDGSLITTVAGGGDSNDNGIPATAAILSGPHALAFDQAGNLYINETNRVRMLTPKGIILPVADTNSSGGFSGDGGSAATAQFDQLRGIAVGLNGTLYVSDVNNARVRALQPVQLLSQDVVSGASLTPGAIAPGEVINIDGSNVATSDDNGQLDPTQLQVIFDGYQAPVVSVQGTQIAAVVPFEEDGNTSAQLQIIYKGNPSNNVTLNVAPVAPAIFTVSGSTGQAQVMNADGSPNSADNPATVGDVVTIIATGGGQTNPPGIDGQVAVDSSSMPVQQVSVQIDGQDAPVSSAGGIPGMVAGYLGVSVTVPAVSGPTLPLLLTIGGVNSQAQVTIAVQ
jgi:uncharacterized protein (TIGR03437 family)